ncbi:Zinc import ATP-binding protein ZnuC [Roseovarius albus]|uniref:Zinc import ATP-binding protein ZnuC n=1 Tax=Roseovarius albus TaxID=1247867 RepID=A0A1X6YH90_9RHOB|nr:metal ABC transporter ATP-binding protein [Roseovarius albus]SLN20861.1 Zinc import ATP-binding protein ZnuC [Roseovarius albus]
MTLLTVENLDITLGGQNILSHVNLNIQRGEILTIVGPNGSGKSTLLKAITGALKPTAGRITRKPCLRIGYVPQKLHVDVTLPLTVRAFLNLPTRHKAARIQYALDQAGLPDLGARQLSALSGGQLQRVLLARALLEQPDLLILDEATQGLDQPGSADFYRHIEEVRQNSGCAVLMVSHELHVVMSTSDRVICLNGHVCCEGKPDVVASAPEYRAIFGSGTQGALALYRHDHDHDHHDCTTHEGQHHHA